MSIFLDNEGQLPSEIYSENPHELCEYYHELLYELDLNEEELIQFSISSGKLPKGISLSPEGIIKGSPLPLDGYHPIKNYVLKEFASKSPNDIPFPDCYKSIDNPNNLEPLTVKDILEMKTHHYSGRTWGIKGHLAYSIDNPGGEKTKFYFTVELKTKYIVAEPPEGEENTDPNGEPGDEIITNNYREFYIQPIAVWDPEAFAVAYGDSTKSLKNDKKEVLTGEEYVQWRESQGHKFAKKC